MEPGTIAAVVGVLLTFAVLNYYVVSFQINRHDAGRQEHTEEIRELKRDADVESKSLREANSMLEREILQLKAELAREYVRREDWIRFGATLDAKMDAMRAEIHEEMQELKGRIDGRRN